MLTITQLVEYLKSHGINVLSSNDSFITAENVYFNVNTGITTVEQENVPANITAVRAWLNY